MGAARYLQRYRLDTDENFLARKHVTQVRVFKRVIDTLIVIIAVSTALMTFDPSGNTASACLPPPAPPA